MRTENEEGMSMNCFVPMSRSKSDIFTSTHRIDSRYGLVGIEFVQRVSNSVVSITKMQDLLFVGLVTPETRADMQSSRSPKASGSFFSSSKRANCLLPSRSCCCSSSSLHLCLLRRDLLIQVHIHRILARRDRPAAGREHTTRESTLFE